MALPNVGVVSTQDLTALFTAVDTQLNQFKFDETTVAEKIALVTQRPGRVVEHAFSATTSLPEVWPLGADREVHDPQVFKASVTNERVAPKDIKTYMATMDWDCYGVLSNELGKFVSRSKRIWDIMLARMMLSNPVGYDGSQLFSTTHPANPNDPGLGIYSNDLPATDLDEAGLAAALNVFYQMKWLDGGLLNMPMDELYLVVPNAQLELKAKKLVFGTLTPQLGPAANTSVAASNVIPMLKGIVKDVLVLPELQDANISGSNKRWYLVNASQPSFRPLLVNVVQWPVFHYTGLSPNDWSRVQKGAIYYGYEANGGVAPAVPQMIVRATTP